MEKKYIRVAQTPGELAAKYRISTKILRRMLNKHRDQIGERVSKYFTPLQVNTIYECLGPPSHK